MSTLPTCSHPEWVIDETTFPADLSADASDTVFCLSNGVFGSRGSMPFAPVGTHGTLFGGLYADAPSELIWVPSSEHPGRDMEGFPSDEAILRDQRVITMPIAPNLWRIDLELGARRVSVTRLQRVLDLRQGILHWRAEAQIEGHDWMIHGCRVVSLRRRQVAAERIVFTPAGETSRCVFSLGLDCAMRNGGKVSLWQNEVIASVDEARFMAWHADATGRNGSAAVALACCVNGEPTTFPETATAQPWTYVWAEGQTIVDRFVGLSSSVSSTAPERDALAACREAADTGFDELVSEQMAEWQDIWQRADIRIDGPLEEQLAVRYGIFQIASSFPRSSDYSIGANFLTGERYRGMVFWDTDVFLLPYLIRMFPERARDHLEYRYRTLIQAQQIASDQGACGARYPWEAAPDGTDATAPWLHLQETQLHVTADVAWGVLEYMRWTGDTEFMEEKGRAILRECARFWTERIERDDGNIRNACGPDENHPVVDNNAFTNGLVAEVLRGAAERCGPEVAQDEKTQWLNAAESIRAFHARDDGVIEQHDGFFSLPIVEVNAESYFSDKFQTIKQADVLMLPFLFPAHFSPEQLAANYEYYEPKSTHESSLSAGVHAVSAARLGRMEEAHRMFLKTARTDLANEYGNTQFGLHAAATAMIPRIVMEGFAGLDMADSEVRSEAHLPDSWKSIEFKVTCRGKQLPVAVSRSGD